ncbi:MAG: 2-isopropylmalate synthase [Lachnospiraceae bacterium]|nr:2-isopropylmalate synthase [Lachnospiraceae bacterium]
MMDASKYRVGYFPVDKRYNMWTEKDHIEKPPVWCSVDMRDGNQSLVIPMSLEEKLEYYKMLLEVGFKEIEVGFPAASETEYEFLRTLIDNQMIPKDVTVQVLTQCREHIIRKTFDACKGAPSAIIHFYNSVSVAQREQVFKKSKEEIKQIAIDGAKLVKKLASEYEGNFRFEYSPESFTGTEPEYALEVCNAVLDILEPGPDNNVIINLPVTVEMSLPHVYASQVAYMSENLKYREYVTVSLHPHNDRGTGVADAELALLAGADRVEGTLFGNGERTGNVDIITLAMNMYSHGVDPKLNFSDMNRLVEIYERCTRMQVYERAPYAGALVFAAFSGSHQDAIAKGMKYRGKKNLHEWSVPYIPIDPKDIGRTYDADVIRVNSQSGKGGIGYLLEQSFGYNLPAKMREHLSYLCKDISDHEHRELKADEVLGIFAENYLNIQSEICVTDFDFMRENDIVKITITFMQNGEETELEAEGNGSLNAVSNALKEYTGKEYTLQVFTQHSMQGQGSGSVAASYIGLETETGEFFWGAGTDTDIIKASTNALLSAFHNMTEGGK